MYGCATCLSLCQGQHWQNSGVCVRVSTLHWCQQLVNRDLGLTCSHPPCFHPCYWLNRLLGQPGICKGSVKGKGMKGCSGVTLLLGAGIVACSMAVATKDVFSASLDQVKLGLYATKTWHFPSPPSWLPVWCSVLIQSDPKLELCSPEVTLLFWFYLFYSNT